MVMVMSGRMSWWEEVDNRAPTVDMGRKSPALLSVVVVVKGRLTSRKWDRRAVAVAVVAVDAVAAAAMIGRRRVGRTWARGQGLGSNYCCCYCCCYYWMW